MLTKNGEKTYFEVQNYYLPGNIQNIFKIIVIIISQSSTKETRRITIPYSSYKKKEKDKFEKAIRSWSLFAFRYTLNVLCKLCMLYSEIKMKGKSSDDVSLNVNQFKHI